MNETNNNVTTYIIQMIPQQTELCVMMLSVWQYETAAVHSEDTQNPEVHDMIMHACRVIGKWQGHSACMAYTFFFSLKNLTQNLNYLILNANIHSFLILTIL